ncbi:hypothetical protein L593_12655 [Salinarchaeum sp. Harcht-Bsk1]|uniref:hypothetical protein n=1 Tax=Salinarchaeum sp. Harcht-Bsk1 TaxID=1333523 RepID=UPI0003423005|nr:hypothetical protein [Salinarchaeum sp. Harcht-Bsk1]AGN02470.1 hypothetical protein L593_12655 [Salinarchaeum sp. Harcht-Bsk1]
MQRRAFLAGAVGIAGGLAGCSDVLPGSGDSNDGGDDGPAGAVRGLYEAAFSGDVEEANAYIHSEADLDPLTQSQADSFQAVDARVESVEVVEQSGDTATVQARLSAVPDDSSERQTLPSIRLELRTENGEWKVYDDASADDAPVAPRVQWESSERTDADGSVTAVTFTHAGGDTVPSGTLSVRASGSTASAPNGTDVTAGTTLVVPTEGRGNSMAASTDILLGWSNPDDGSSQILAEHTLTSPTVGTLAERLRLE